MFYINIDHIVELYSVDTPAESYVMIEIDSIDHTEESSKAFGEWRGHFYEEVKIPCANIEVAEKWINELIACKDRFVAIPNELQ